ncbi:hypothetical protein FNO01nite_34820 [Flavobacterium noncentrifugens]|nr:hypothetical protein [Flavobacterium noncentrifugens]GEP52810.1 hypothetical protein FNO01nite_34820 [Flavobacterium noncentrifugens]
MSIITYLKEVSTFKKILGPMFICLGLFSIAMLSILFGVIFSVIGLNLLSTEGSQINLHNNTYRNIKSIFGYKFGKWQPCPGFEYVSVFKTKENQTIRVITAEATFQSDIILLNLFYKGNKHITFYKTSDKVNAFETAEKFKSVFNIDILDATENEKRWL